MRLIVPFVDSERGHRPTIYSIKQAILRPSLMSKTEGAMSSTISGTHNVRIFPVIRGTKKIVLLITLLFVDRFQKNQVLLKAEDLSYLSISIKQGLITRN